MANWKETSEESRKRWEKNADYWDQYMGDDSNEFHREIVRPDTEKLLSVQPGDRVLDIACGNGNFSKRLVDLGAKVTAFDYSFTMVEHAIRRCQKHRKHIDFHVLDATQYEQLMQLKENGPYDKAVANMAMMDIADIQPLLQAVHDLLAPHGCFVFSTSHPCFQTPGMRRVVENEEAGSDIIQRRGLHLFQYTTPCHFQGIALVDQPVSQFYYHRPLAELFTLCFQTGFVLDGFAEPVFAEKEGHQFDWSEFPPVIIARWRRE